MRRSPSAAILPLRLDKKELFLLLHPEPSDFAPSNRLAAQRHNQAWKQFLLSRALLRQNNVTPSLVVPLRGESIGRREIRRHQLSSAWSSR